MDKTKAKEIADRLQFLHIATLYDLLQRPNATRTTILYDAAKQLYADMVRRIPPTAETTAKSELAGQAQEVFKTDNTRKLYDEALRQASIERLLRELDDIINRTTDKEIHLKQAALFLAEAQKERWTEQEARNKLKEHAIKRKWFLQLPTTERVTRYSVPIVIHSMIGHNVTVQMQSVQCLSLSIAPVVVSSFRVILSIVIIVEFPVGNRYYVDNLLQEILRLLDTNDLISVNDLASVEVQIDEAERAWPSGDKDERARKINDYKDLCQKKRGNNQKYQQEIIYELDQLIKQRKFFSARNVIKKKKGPTFADLDEKQRIIDDAIQQAEDLLRQVSANVSLSQDDKIARCQQALVICADYQIARDRLSKMPPSEPSNLTAKIHGTVVRLKWTSSTTSGVVYKLIRKSGAQPNRITDGRLLDTITGNSYDDTSPEIGVPLYYAVFAVFALLDTVISDTAAYLTQPVMMVQDVLQFSAQIDSHLVTLSWEPPPHVHSIIIVRKELSPPTSSSDGVRLSHIGPTQKSIEDRHVQNEQTYYYGIYCQFKSADGHLQLSSGAFISATPETPPAAIADEDIQITEAQINETEREVHIRWKPPKKGKVVIFKTPQPLRKEGLVISEI